MSLGYLITASALMEWDKQPTPSAWLGHIPFGTWLVGTTKPRVLVELGTHYGHSYFAFCKSVQSNGLATRCYAVDTWRGDLHAGQYTDDIYKGVIQHNNRHYQAFSHLLRMTFDEAAAQFDDGSIDLLHIDGLHTYEAVRHDFETWLPKLSTRAVVLFHDTAVHGRGFGVGRFWRELSPRYPNIDFDHSHGLGVLFVGAEQPGVVHEIVKDAEVPEQRALICQFFERLGRSVELEGKLLHLAQFAVDPSGDMGISQIGEAPSETRIGSAVGYKRVARAVHRMIQLAPAALRHGGGLKNTIVKAFRIYRQEGLSGIQRGFLAAQTASQRLDGAWNPRDYAAWIRLYDTLTDPARAAMRGRIRYFRHRPVISIILSVSHFTDGLSKTIESIRTQIYTDWELYIAADASAAPEVHGICDRYRADIRIRALTRQPNSPLFEHINNILTQSAGDWVTFPEAGDILAEHALFCIADSINKHPQARLIYTDEDTIDELGTRSAPYFKCDWNVDLFYSQNMLGRLCVYQTPLVRRAGAFTPDTESSQGYDLALRYIELICAAQIQHIPKVLCHHRGRQNGAEHPSKHDALPAVTAVNALNAHFRRRGVRAQAEHVGPGYRIRYALPDPLPLVSLIIPTRNGLDLIRRCVHSIVSKTTYPNYEIIIVDNGTDDPETLSYFRTLEADRRIRTMRDERPFNYSALNNTAVQQARGEIIGLLNNDCEVITPDWLSEMVGHALRPEIGAVGARLWYPDDTLQHAGVILGLGGIAGHPHRGLPHGDAGFHDRARLTQNFSAVTAACLVVRRKVYQEAGGLNEEELPVAFNDVDFCLRLREAGYLNVWTPHAELYHHESASRGIDNTCEKKSRFRNETAYMKRRWGPFLENDPAHSPNLALDYGGFAFSWPPRK